MHALQAGFENAEKADLMIVLGSSLRVSPANQMPKEAQRRGAKLVIINLQSTPLDDECDLRINGETDAVMARVAAKLGLEIPPFNVEELFNSSVAVPAPQPTESATVEAA